MKVLFTSLFALMLMNSFAGDFKVKFEVETVDHSSIEGATILVFEKGVEIASEKIASDGDAKIKLEEGKLYEAWVLKPGYYAHVIHNIHTEGDGKFKVTLYKSKDALPSDYTSYGKVNREFDNVKSMKIPVELLGDSVHVVSEEFMTKAESKSLKNIQSIAKNQEKSQKKIDKILKDQLKLKEDMLQLRAKIDAGETERTSGEEDMLKKQEEMVKMQHNLEKLAY